MSVTDYKNTGPNPRATVQTQPIPGKSQVANSEGGYVFQLDDFSRLNRFLILGTSEGSYYSGKNELTKENADVVIRCLKEDGIRTVNDIVSISDSGRAPKNDEAIYALALATVPEFADEATRSAAFNALPKVARTGTHLFQFCDAVNSLRGWGRGLRKAVASWYEDKNVDDLAYQLVKYRQRNGWTHKDALRLSHPDGHFGNAPLYEWATSGDLPDAAYKPVAIDAYQKAQGAASAEEIVKLIGQYGRSLPREAIPTQFTGDALVQAAQIDAGVPLNALLRNLANYTRSGVISTGSSYTDTVIKQITDVGALRNARVHPLNILRALYTYSSGESVRGTNTWHPVTAIIDALDDAFYASFGNVEPTGKRRLIALDVSGSMGWSFIGGIKGFTARDASAALALVSLATGDPTEVIGFTGAGRSQFGWGGNGKNAGIDVGFNGVSGLNISARQRLGDAVAAISNLPFGGTDCSLPVEYALAKGKNFDSFEIYTDSETYMGGRHVTQALREYRATHVYDAKLVVNGMVSNGFSIADPDDPYQLDVVGFDTAAPQVISEFIKGNV